MSVRVCYLERTARGRVMTGLRLTGVGVDERWRSTGAGVTAYEDASAWIREKLAESRSAHALTMLCMDADGAVCSWITTQSLDPEAISTVARDGHSATGDDNAPAMTPSGFIGGESDESVVQALVAAPAETKRAPFGRKTSEESAKSLRVPVLTAADVGAKLLIDSLDRLGVTVERTCTIWHAMTGAWDRQIRAGEAIDMRTTAVVCLHADHDGTGRLLWSWSKGGSLLLGGSMRLSPSRTVGETSTEDGALIVADSAPAPALGETEVGRLVTEWLSWAAQTGEAPSRIICILPELPANEQGVPAAPAFAQQLAAGWNNSTVDLVTDGEPITATLRRFAEALDNTATGTPTPGSAMVQLSLRPGRAHRKMFVWTSLVCIALSGAMGLVSWRLSAESARKRLAAAEWQNRWRELLQEQFPQAVAAPVPGEPPRPAPIEQVREEIARLQDLRAPADRPEATMPVLQELESLSLIIANPEYTIESVEFDSLRDVRLNLQVNSLEEAEQLLESLQSIEGLHTVDWEAKYPSGSARPENMQKLKMSYIGRWNPELKRKPRGGGA